MRYVSTFIPGFGEVIREWLILHIKDIKITNSLDGLVAYNTREDIFKIIKSRLFNNTFLILTEHSSGHNSVDIILDRFLKCRLNPDIILGILQKFKIRSFKIACFDENIPAPVNKIARTKAEKRIIVELGLRLKIDKPDTEFWCLKRREGLGLFLLKLTKSVGNEKTLRPGELRPNIARLICLLSEPDVNDIFWDPFSGSGSIPLARCEMSGYAKIIASDADSTKVAVLKEKIKKLGLPKNKFLIQKLDFIQSDLPVTEKVTKIVIDPPWGDFAPTSMALDDFYRRIFNKCASYLCTGGLLILLTSKKDLIDRLLEEYKNQFTLSKRLDILVSGKKAVLVKLNRL